METFHHDYETPPYGHAHVLSDRPVQTGIAPRPPQSNSWTEFSRGSRYFQGNRSPNNYERELYGYSVSWLHHKGRNRHHFEYWLDYNEHQYGGVKGMRMPRRYVAEMYCDRVAACKIYQKEAYTQQSAVRYFCKGGGKILMHPETRKEIGFLLTMLGKREKKKQQNISEIYISREEVFLRITGNMKASKRSTQQWE